MRLHVEDQFGVPTSPLHCSLGSLFNNGSVGGGMGGGGGGGGGGANPQLSSFTSPGLDPNMIARVMQFQNMGAGAGQQPPQQPGMPPQQPGMPQPGMNGAPPPRNPFGTIQQGMGMGGMPPPPQPPQGGMGGMPPGGGGGGQPELMRAIMALMGRQAQ